MASLRSTYEALGIDLIDHPNNDIGAILAKSTTRGPATLTVVPQGLTFQPVNTAATPANDLNV